MSFRIIGDEIEYDYRPVARFIVPASSTPRGCAEDALWLCNPETIEREEEALRAEYTDEIKELESKVEELESCVKVLEQDLDRVTEPGGAALVAELRKDRDKWRAKAVAYADEIRRLNAPKPRRRKPR